MFARSKQGVVDVVAGDEPLNREHVEEVSQLLDECICEGQPRYVSRSTRFREGLCVPKTDPSLFSGSCCFPLVVMV